MANRSKVQTATFVAVSTEKLKRGLVKEMGDPAARRRTITFTDFVDAFCGRQFNGTKVTQHQLRRHVSWMKSQGVLKVAAKARAAKAGAR
ncbi:MAG: hypothetical protein ABSF71_40845 [Terriglobia bacterium]